MPDFLDVRSQGFQFLIRQLRQVRGSEEQVVMGVVCVQLRHDALDLFSQRLTSDLRHVGLNLVDVTLRHLRQVLCQLGENRNFRVLGILDGTHETVCNAG